MTRSNSDARRLASRSDLRTCFDVAVSTGELDAVEGAGPRTETGGLKRPTMKRQARSLRCFRKIERRAPTRRSVGSVRSSIRALAFALVLFGFIFDATGSRAQSVIDEWSAVRVPPPPPLREVTADPANTALLVMDFNKKRCNAQSRPRCAIAAPKIADLLARARAAGMIVVHTLSGPTETSDMLPLLAPIQGETILRPGLDKFLDQNLVADLRQHGVKRVILTGTSANGAVLFSAGGAVMRGFDAIVPVDGMPADTPYQEQFTVWNLAHGPDLAEHVILTRTDMLLIKGPDRR